MILDGMLLQVIGQSTADRILTGVAWIGIVLLAAIILVAASTTARNLRRH